MRVVGGVRRGAIAESAKRRLTPPTEEKQRPDRHLSINTTPWTPLYILRCVPSCVMHNSFLMVAQRFRRKNLLQTYCETFTKPVTPALPRYSTDACRGIDRPFVSASLHNCHSSPSPTGGSLVSGSPAMRGHTPAKRVWGGFFSDAVCDGSV